MSKFELKPGMICSTDSSNYRDATYGKIWVIFSNKNTKNGLSAICYGHNSIWSSDVDSENMIISGLKIYAVFDSPKLTLTDGDALWTRHEIKEMSISEIEDKLNMQPGTLRIKKENQNSKEC